MRHLLIPLILAGCAQTQPQFVYPDSNPGKTQETYHGTTVADPYRWLEDDLSAETASWVKAQNEVTFNYLDSLPRRHEIRERLTELWNYEKLSTPTQHGDNWFWSRNDGLQNQSVVYVGDGPYQNGQVLLDPNQFSEDGTRALSGMSASEDGKYVAYSVSGGGSDWQTWKVLNVANGKDTSDELSWIKFSRMSWLHDNSGFFYTGYPAPKGSELSAVNSNAKLFFHKLGTPQTNDQVVLYFPEHPLWGYSAEISEDGNWLFIYGHEGTERKNRLWRVDLHGNWNDVQPVFTEFDASYSFLTADGDLAWFKTTLDAPNGKIIAVNPDNIDQDHLQTIIPESTDVLTSVSFVGGKLLCNYLHNAHSVTKAYTLEGKHLWDVKFPALGSSGGFGGKATSNQAWYSFKSFTYPPTIFSLELNTGKSTLQKSPKVDFNPNDFVTEQVWYPSKDGTKVPMFLVHHKNVKANGEAPVQLYGYGGFNISLTPSFSPANLVWMEMGGVYAMPNLRGGGEFGQAWHDAGTVHQKQNVFDDFIAAAEWLCESGWTKPARLAIRGGSNGGLLVGACMTQRPDLFGACLPAVGVLDMLRYHKFTIGWAWASDYGTSDDSKHFETLLKYSPYHNVKKGVAYPATMVTTGDHDDRVVPAHSFKFAAALQAAQAGSAPTLIRIETRGGHGAGKPTSMRINEYADLWAFLAAELSM